MASIPNFLNNYQTPLGAAFKNLIGAVASAPDAAKQQAEADNANLLHWKVGGRQQLADLFGNAYGQPEAGAMQPAPAVSVPAAGASFPATAPQGIAGRIAQLAPAGPAVNAPTPTPRPDLPGETPSPIAAAFQATTPQAAPQAAPQGGPQRAPLDFGKAISAAIYGEMDPKDLAGFNLFGAANDFGATDQRTQNAQVGAGEGYDNTFGALDRKQNDSTANNLREQDTSRANNEETNATSRANNADNIKKDYGIASIHEAGEDRRNERKLSVTDKKQAAADQARLATSDIVTSKVDDALKHVGSWTTGIVGSQLNKVPGSEGYTLSRDIDTIKANLGFDTLAAMRAASPTGGALGAVSDYENKMLQSTVSALDPGLSEEELRKNLGEVKKHYENVRDLINGRMPKGVAAPHAPAQHEEWVRGPDGKLQRKQ